MKSLAEFKRKMTEGSKWTFRAHWTLWEDTERTLTKRQTNAAAFTHPYKKVVDSWIYFPKAKECIFANGGVYIVEPQLQGPFKEWLQKNGEVRKYPDRYLFYKPIEESEQQ